MIMRSSACATLAAMEKQASNKQPRVLLLQRDPIRASALRLAVIIRVEVIRDFRARGFPDTLARADVFERLVEVLDPKREADHEGVQRNRHHSRLIRAF